MNDLHGLTPEQLDTIAGYLRGRALQRSLAELKLPRPLSGQPTEEQQANNRALFATMAAEAAKKVADLSAREGAYFDGLRFALSMPHPEEE